jgi:hypothetical protein
MQSIRLPITRRLLSLLLLTFFGFFTAETIIADSCDGDASPGALSISDSTAPDRSPESGGSLPTHSMHVCHCSHAHAGSIGIVRALEELVVRPGSLSGQSLRTPRTAPPQPPIRPPVA